MADAARVHVDRRVDAKPPSPSRWMPTHRAADVFTVGPFLAFAAGIGTGADWATWH